MTDFQPIIDTAVLSIQPHEVEPGKVYLVSTPSGPETIDLTGDEFKDAPSIKRGSTIVRDAVSFQTYFEKHSDQDSEVYADAEKLSVTAVLDAHTADAARWRGHRLTLALRKTEAWDQWKAYDDRLMAQVQFAEFLEDHVAELLEPSGADMLEIAQSIQAATKVEFKSASRLASGERQLQFVETIQAKAGQRGQLTIPETFTVGLVPFEGSEGYRLTARLRYRIGRDGELSMGYKLDRPADILRTAFQDVVTAIGEQIDQPVMNGTPA